MFKFIGVVVVLAGVIAFVGYFMGWFHMSASSDGGAVNVNVTVDREELRSDIKSTRESIVGKDEKNAAPLK